MTQLENIKNRLIDRIMSSKNEKLLSAIENIFIVTEEPVAYTSEQFEMLMLAEEDIKYGNVISQEDLDKMDEEWLK